MSGLLDRLAGVAGRRGGHAPRRLGPALRRLDPDLRTTVGSVVLPNPVMTASGTSGHGAELAAYLDLGALGAVVAKSLSAGPWPGNPAPRVVATTGGMLNSVGLQGPGVEAWLERDLPELVATGARVVASIWGGRVEDYAKAAAMLAEAPPAVVAVEVNVSCPNLEDRRRMFAHSPTAVAEAVAAAGACMRPRWAKLSPNVADIAEIAEAALSAGAEALTLVNTLLGLSIDPLTRRPRLGAGGGGLSGPAVHPVAVRAVFDCRAAFPGVPIVGVGGVATGADAVELLLAGASAVQVGTATFADPRAPGRVLDELSRWCLRHGVERLSELVGAAHAHELVAFRGRIA
ncbi:MAG: dihydroorotate dehydrogenase, partial [Acidimicrobiales bacterium]